MKINWKLRFKNKYTLTALVSALALFINNVTQAFGLDYSQSVEQGVGVVTSIITILAGAGIIIDSTSKGAKDSDIVLTYTKPRDSKLESQQVVWSKDKQQAPANQFVITPERQEFTPKEYDTNEPFTDDSDEVEFDVAEYEVDEDLPRGASAKHDDMILKVSDNHDS